MGYGKNELLGKTDYDFFPKKEGDIFWEKDEVVFKTQKENINEENFTDSKGMIHIVITKKVFFKTEDGEEFIVGIIRDITELKKMSLELSKKMETVITFNKVAVGREMRMIELKKEVDALLRRLNEKTKYNV